MGAQDRKGGTWLELPFWRQVKYYFLCILVGIIIGFILFAIGIYTPLYHVILSSTADFLIENWWVTPSTILIFSLIVYLGRPKKKKTTLEVKRQQ
jgi:ABC-type amino acid transport system permease subunit